MNSAQAIPLVGACAAPVLNVLKICALDLFAKG